MLWVYISKLKSFSGYLHIRKILFILEASKNEDMCLYTSQRAPKIAETPIRCMKVVCKNANGSCSPLICTINNDSVFYCVGNETKIRYH